MLELSSSDLQTIEDVHRLWTQAELAGDSLAVLRMCTDDVVWIPPDSPVLEGREAIKRWLKRTEVEIKNLEISDVRIYGSGTVAYKTGNYNTTYRIGDSTEVMGMRGTHLWILHRTGNSEWRVAIVTWSSIEAG